MCRGDFLHPVEDITSIYSMLEGAGSSWLGNWLEEVQQWSPDLKVDNKRDVWLSCYGGIPLNLWNTDTFHNIGKNWGKVITLDGARNIRRVFFLNGKGEIITNVFEAINQVFALDFNGYSYPVRVIEEQAVVPLTF